ncbi:hypothetical protein GUITHDRAFT_144151 [Guillardia theta CCMP2712]|uniref:Uncharacterized protein n=1 Tax=Guillardia theta (strain CCMP2712) TaxID=905079 RepID=L1IR26_GUITC|nr:hypothetical protein GUITHDRAFT_144151 [Guillardia theta CCMP2712]EKX38552.1 hypothetical protein GUITHDRAFT_144151 [Guillardia theta CCMP2712]|eukprot:XP_005825532.1 hypothetical protein GUITHDRAFT_144151 [Guillardia theta CCMP2712]
MSDMTRKELEVYRSQADVLQYQQRNAEVLAGDISKEANLALQELGREILHLSSTLDQVVGEDRGVSEVENDDMAQEINRLEDLNFLAETSLLKYTSELEDSRRMLDEAVSRVVELEDALKKFEDSKMYHETKTIQAQESNVVMEENNKMGNMDSPSRNSVEMDGEDDKKKIIRLVASIQNLQEVQARVELDCVDLCDQMNEINEILKGCCCKECRDKSREFLGQMEKLQKSNLSCQRSPQRNLIAANLIAANAQEHIVSLNKELTEVEKERDQLISQLELCQEEIAAEIDKHLADLQEAAERLAQSQRRERFFCEQIDGLNSEMGMMLEEVKAIREDAKANSMLTQAPPEDGSRERFLQELEQMTSVFEGELEELHLKLVKSKESWSKEHIAQIGRLSFFETVESKLSLVLNMSSGQGTTNLSGPSLPSHLPQQDSEDLKMMMEDLKAALEEMRSRDIQDDDNSVYVAHIDDLVVAYESGVFNRKSTSVDGDELRWQEHVNRVAEEELRAELLKVGLVTARLKTQQAVKENLHNYQMSEMSSQISKLQQDNQMLQETILNKEDALRGKVCSHCEDDIIEMLKENKRSLLLDLHALESLKEILMNPAFCCQRA